MSAGGWRCCWAAARSRASRGRPPPAGTSRGSWPSWCPRTWTRTCSSPTRRGPPSPPTPSKPSWSGASLSGTTWLWRPRPRGRRPPKSRLSPAFCLPVSFLRVLGRRALRPPCSPPGSRDQPGIRKQAWEDVWLAPAQDTDPWRSPLVGVTGTSPASKRPPGGSGDRVEWPSRMGPGLPAEGARPPQGLPPGTSSGGWPGRA